MAGPELGGGSQHGSGLRREERRPWAQMKSREEAAQREAGGGWGSGQGGAWRPQSRVPWVVMGSHVRAAKPGHEGADEHS